MKTKWEGQFFEKNPRIQFDVVFDSESNGGIFDSLAPFGGELWRFETFEICATPTAYAKIFWEIFLSQ